MFANISWSNYSIAVIVLLLCWYLILGFKFYQKEFKHVLTGKQKIGFPIPGIKKAKSVQQEGIQDGIYRSDLSNSFNESFSTLEDAEELLRQLVTAASEYAQSSMPRDGFLNYLKLILNEYPFVKNSSLRTNINHLLIAECQKYPELLLDYPEVDQLWDDNTQ